MDQIIDVGMGLFLLSVCWLPWRNEVGFNIIEAGLLFSLSDMDVDILLLVNHMQFGGPSETMNRKGPRAVQTVCVFLTYLFIFNFFSPYNPLVLTCVLWACMCLWLLILQKLSDSIPQYVIICTREVALKDKTGKSKKLMNIFKDSKNKTKISNLSVYCRSPLPFPT